MERDWKNFRRTYNRLKIISQEKFQLNLPQLISLSITMHLYQIFLRIMTFIYLSSMPETMPKAQAEISLKIQAPAAAIMFLSLRVQD